jgi:2-polyprenyl-3-methyl-5-hydroxy-6-metoxy-1,4-benzoquinol methylase
VKLFQTKYVTEFEGIPLNGVRRHAFNKLNQDIYSQKIKINQIKECFCGASNFLALSQLDRFGLPFGSQICKSCGLVTQTIRIDESSMKYFYESIYWPLIEGKEGNYFTFSEESHSDPFFSSQMNFEKKEITIFEVGCGAGNRILNLSSIFEKKGYVVDKCGCDYSINALKVAQNRKIKTVQGGMKDLANLGKADIVILSHVFEHFTDLKHAMSELEKLVHDKSFIYIEVPGINDLENKKEYKYNYQMYSVLAHTYNFSLQSLTNVMNYGDFELITGDEFVRTLFKLSKKDSLKSEFISAFSDTMVALEKANVKSEKYKRFRNSYFVNYLIKIIKAFLDRDT